MTARNQKPSENDAPEAFHWIQHPRKKAFLLHFAVHGQVGKAAAIAGIERTTSWCWRRDDPEFLEAYQLAESLYATALEDEISRRAMEGVERPVFQGKELVGHIREYSDVLLIFRTKGALPKKYAERYHIDVEDRVRQVAQELGLSVEDTESAVAEAQRITAKSGKK